MRLLSTWKSANWKTLAEICTRFKHSTVADPLDRAINLMRNGIPIVIDWFIICSGVALPHARAQINTWNNAATLSTGVIEMIFNDIIFKMWMFNAMKLHLKTPARWHPLFSYLKCKRTVGVYVISMKTFHVCGDRFIYPVHTCVCIFQVHVHNE